MPHALSTWNYQDSDAVQGELVDRRIADVEAVARWLDYAFVLPGGFRFGLAGIVGLIPGIGDLIDALVSFYIVKRALQLGIPRIGVVRMMLNIAIEGIAGAVPFLGDVFDIAFKANRRNYLLINSYLAQPQRQHGRDWLFLLGTLLLVTAAVILPIFALAILIRRFAR